jgi:hypothetical protein
MPSGFPGVGHRYFVDFVAFQVELDFASEASLTYYNLDKNGNKVGSETVTIKVEPITDGIFLMTWQESDIDDGRSHRGLQPTNHRHQYHGAESHLRSVTARSGSCHEHNFHESNFALRIHR